MDEMKEAICTELNVNEQTVYDKHRFGEPGGCRTTIVEIWLIRMTQYTWPGK